METIFSIDIFNKLILLASDPIQVEKSFSWLNFSSRSLHILTAGILVGGLFMLRYAVVPTLSENNSSTENDSSDIQKTILRRWSKLVMFSSLILMASGIYNLLKTVMNFDVPPSYHMVFGIKFLLAIYVIFVASLVSGRTAAADRFRQRASFWLSTAVIAVILIVGLAAVLRQAHPLLPKTEEPRASSNYSSNAYFG